MRSAEASRQEVGSAECGVAEATRLTHLVAERRTEFDRGVALSPPKCVWPVG